MYRFLRRKDDPWEVVQTNDIRPTLMYDEDDAAIHVRNCSTTDQAITVLHDINDITNIREAICATRSQLMRRLKENGFNTLLTESWQLTIYRKRKKHRVEVTYRGRPACVEGGKRDNVSPPWLDILDVP
ncbi:hypothetical protein K474DRAFT_1655591 [Panus rudis PR-1116 ss-1]|nr:hypothetical protein K474DRAFT_1655591 [Panus rudis PR-1116 ss-1]